MVNSSSTLFVIVTSNYGSVKRSFCSTLSSNAFLSMLVITMTNNNVAIHFLSLKEQFHHVCHWMCGGMNGCNGSVCFGFFDWFEEEGMYLITQSTTPTAKAENIITEAPKHPFLTGVEQVNIRILGFDVGPFPRCVVRIYNIIQEVKGLLKY